MKWLNHTEGRSDSDSTGLVCTSYHKTIKDKRTGIEQLFITRNKSLCMSVRCCVHMFKVQCGHFNDVSTKMIAGGMANDANSH